MQKTTIALTLSLLLSGCQLSPTHTVAADPASASSELKANQNFERFSNEFIDAMWQQFPESALWAGNDQYATVLEVPNAEKRAADAAFAHRYLAQLAQFKTQPLSANQRTDVALIENQLQSLLFEINELKSYQWNPANYNVAGSFAQILNSRSKTDLQKFEQVLARMTDVPAYYQAAKANISQPTKPHTELAIGQNQGAFSVFNDELLTQVDQSALSPEQKALFHQRFTASVTAIKDYIAFLTDLNSKLTEQNSRSFRLGEDLYEKKFALDIQSGYTAKQMYQKAMADKQQVLGKMHELTAQLWPKYFAKQPMPSDAQQATRQLIDHLSNKHVAANDFVSEIRQQIPTLEQFVRDHDLLTLDPNKPLVVRETPEYMRGFAGASISAPGPYDKAENTYYNVTPLDGMSDAQQQSYLKEYNHWILQVLNIHEAIPGHYAQLVYSNESPSLIKSLFGNGAMVEGWAVYSERMMLEQGYGNFEPELWLMYYKWNLRVICNTILDYSIHVLNLSEQQALDLLQNQAFQQQAEAQGKWRRATLSQVQLTSYYSGYREIYDFREQLKAEQGERFNLKAFHEQFLSYGSAPVKFVKQLMQ